MLGRPQRTSNNPGSEFNEQRLSLPIFNTPGNPRRRVIGDASHHFGQAMPRGLGLQSPYSIGSTHTGRIEPSLASQFHFRGDGFHRVGEFQPGVQMPTPPFYIGQLTLKCVVYRQYANDEGKPRVQLQPLITHSVHSLVVLRRTWADLVPLLASASNRRLSPLEAHL